MFDINLMMFIGLGVVVTAVALFLKVVPKEHAWVLERFGHYHTTLAPGVNIVLPLIDRIAYQYDLQETFLEIPSQVYVTREKVEVQVDSVLYFQITDPVKVFYNSNNYRVVITQLAQTTLRSVIGKLEFDKISETSDLISHSVANTLIEAAVDWGVKILRYEITNLAIPKEISHTVQPLTTTKQVRRALSSASEGKQQEAINSSVGM